MDVKLEGQETAEQLSTEDAKTYWNELAAEQAASSNQADEASSSSAPDPSPLEADPAPAAPAPAPAPAVDPIMDRVLAIESQLRRVSNLEGHIGGLHSAIKRLSTEVTASKAATEAIRAEGNAAPTDRQVQNAAGNSQKWKQLREDFPEWADAIDERLSGASTPIDVNQIIKQVREQIPAADAAQLRAEVATQVRREIAEELVEERFPGWKTTINTPEFGDWFNGLPAAERALGESERASDAMKLMAAYQKHRDLIAKAQRTQSQRQQSVAAASSLPTGVPGAAATPDVNNMTKEQLWAFYRDNPNAK